MSEKLLPCPFCGGSNVKTFGPYGWYRQWGISHSCSSFYSGTSEMFQGFPNEAAAIAAWNRRAPDASLRAALEAVVTVYKRDNPMRTADVHDASCSCMRCAVDYADAALTPRTLVPGGQGLDDIPSDYERLASECKLLREVLGKIGMEACAETTVVGMSVALANIRALIKSAALSALREPRS